jgi:hypothetical protein
MLQRYGASAADTVPERRHRCAGPKETLAAALSQPPQRRRAWRRWSAGGSSHAVGADCVPVATSIPSLFPSQPAADPSQADR